MGIAHRICGFLAGLFLLCGGSLAAASWTLSRSVGHFHPSSGVLVALGGTVSLAWLGTGAALAVLALVVRPARPRWKAPV